MRAAACGAQDHPEAFKTNFKGLSAAAQAAGDGAAAGAHRAAGASADVYASSCNAVRFSGCVCGGGGGLARLLVHRGAQITEAGEVYSVDATGTRVTGHLLGKKIVFVASTQVRARARARALALGAGRGCVAPRPRGLQKIVPTMGDAAKRTAEYSVPLESARCRAAYKAPGARLARSGRGAVRRRDVFARAPQACSPRR